MKTSPEPGATTLNRRYISNLITRVYSMQKTRHLVALTTISAGIANASAITTYDHSSTFLADVGSVTKEDFTDTYHFPIDTGVLNEFTNLPGIGIVPGLIKPGVTYSSPVVNDSTFNIDSGAGYAGGFLESLSFINPIEDLTITFDSPTFAFGFDSNELMGTDFDILINFTSGPAYAGSFAVAPSRDMQFFGFRSSQANIASVVISGNGSPVFGFALDNFCFTTDNTAAVPEAGTSAVLLSLGMLGLGMLPRSLSPARQVIARR
jgi:hypothetical protein